ncbi:DNRLRE domain-containing protein [Priestia megaterium]|uniref:DNRLRE domain-containing protein n=1 Tax=Priestia megaterium TaxID=1404 RepID=UPI00345B3CC4
MKRKSISAISKYLCWLIIFTLFVSCLPKQYLAATNSNVSTDQNNQSSERQDAAQINKEIAGKVPNNLPIPPSDSVEKGEVTAQQQENVEVTQDSAGKYTKNVYLDPIHRKDEKNQFQNISTDLEVNKQENTIEPESTSIDVAFEKQTDQGTYATVQDDSNKVEYKLVGAEGEKAFTNANDITAQYEENKVFYRNILPDVDLRNTVFDQSVKEDIILKQYQGLYKFQYLMTTSLQAKLEEDGSITFTNSNGEVVFTLPKPYMSDSNIQPESGEPQTSYDVKYELEKVEKGYKLTVVANKDWLTSKDRVYPVYIDPTTTLGASDDTFVSSAYPTTNYDKFWESASGYYSLKTGYYDSSTGTNYAYVKPDVSNLQGAVIDASTFNLYTAHSYSSTATNVWLDRVDGNWSPGALNWNNKPGSTNIASTSVAKDQVASFDVKNTVQEWINGTRPNYGFKLHENGNGQTYWKKFYASENSTNKPYLSVDYHYPTPTVPSGTVTSNNDSTGYANISWNSIPGATGYRIKMFNGTQYETFDVGNVTSWSTKGKGIWPTAAEIASGRYQLHHDGKGTELATSPSDVYTNAGSHYGSSRYYYFRVSAVFPGGESANSDAYTPIMPMNVPKATPFSNATGTTTGYVNLSWDADPLADGYKVWIYNGKNYESFDVPGKDTTSWTTQGKGIWPTASEITAGSYQLHHDGKGSELAQDPSPVYKASGGSYPNNTNYWFRVTSYNSQGESPLSSPTMPRLPGLEAYYLGMEDFWASFDVPGGTVNAFNGNFVLDETDFSLDGRGPGIDIARTYNSQDTETGMFGKGWNSSLDVKVKEDTNGDVLLIEQDKRIHRFRKVNNTYEAPTGIYLELTKDTNGFYFKDTDQSVTAFKADGKLNYEKDANGNQTTYNYDANGKMNSISDASGRTISLAYTGNYISTITYQNQVTTFTYTNDQLTAVKTPNGRVYKYGYENGKLRFVYDPNDIPSKPSVTEYVYDTNGKLVKVIDTLKKATTIAYNTDTDEVTVTNPKGSKDVYSYNEDGNPTKTVEDADHLKLTTTYDYQNNNLLKKTDPKDQGERTSESYTYDKNGNVLTETDGIGTDTYQYNSNNDVTSMTDSEGHESTVSYNDTNAVSETDQKAKTASVTNYDSYGNVIESSDDLAPATNLVENPSFENALGTEWTKASNSDDGSLSESTPTTTPSGSFWGSNVLKIQPNRKTDLSEGQQSYVAATQKINVQPNKTYTLSGLLKADNLQNADAFFNVYEFDANGKGTPLQSNRFAKITGNTKWKERQMSFKTGSQTTQVQIYLEVESHNAPVSGSALFDTVQLEEGPLSSSFNIVNNSGFEQGDAGWVASVGTSSEGPSAYGVAQDEGFDGEQSMFLERTSKGQASVNIQQDITLNQSTPRNITLTGMSKAENVANVDGKSLDEDYSIWADVTFTDGSAMGYQAKFPTGTHDWSRSAVTINAGDLGKKIQKMRVYAIFRGAFTGKAYFDDIRLLEDNHLVKNVYDSSNNYVTKTIDEKGGAEQFGYDIYGNQTSNTDAKGQQKTSEYNVDNQLTKVTLPNHTSVSYEYDANGNTTKKTVASDSTLQTIFSEYDLDNKLLSYTDALGFKTSHTYDDNGNKIKTELPNGHVLEWSYDTADQITNEKQDGITVFTYEYDANGNETKVTDSLNNVVRTKGYDQGNQLVNMTDRDGSFSWTYKQDSTKITDSSFTQNGTTHKTSYGYNDADDNTTVTDCNGKVYHFDYDESGSVRTYTAGNGSGSSYTYDATGKVTGLEIGTNSNNSILSETYQYDANDNRTGITSYTQDGAIDNTTEYEYDSINQLTKETLPDGTIKEYTYDGFGNRTSVKVTEPGKPAAQTNAEFNAGNELVKYGNETITYDENGNRISDGKFTYKWNADDQLIAITKKGESTPFATYKYDDNDRRIEKTVNGTVTRFYYDGDSINPLYETDGSGNVLRSYVYSMDGVRLSMQAGGKTYYYHYNAHGDVIAMTDDTGNTVVKYTYDAWGNAQKQVTSGQVDINNPFTYAGYMQDDETGMYYLIARYYNPTHGVFLSTDPDAGDDDDPITQNGYAYGDNNPISLIDSDGNRGFGIKNDVKILVTSYVVVKVGTNYVIKKVEKKAIGTVYKIAKYNRKKYYGTTPTKASRNEVLKRDNHTCQYCGSTNKHRMAADHNPSVKAHYNAKGFGISPTARRNWANNPENLRAACSSCNSSKGSKHYPSQWTTASKKNKKKK